MEKTQKNELRHEAMAGAALALEMKRNRERIHIEEPRRDEHGNIKPGEFARVITVEVEPRDIEAILQEVKNEMQ